MQLGVKVNNANYCDVLLLKQLLPDAKLRATFASSAPRVRQEH